MNKKHWNTVEIDSGLPDTELRRMIDHSYELVVQNLPKSKGRTRPLVPPTNSSPGRTRRSRPAS